MDVYDTVPHLRNRSTAVTLLQATPPWRAQEQRRRLAPATGYRWTAEDITELLSADRSDLVELILDSTDDENLLYAVARSTAPAGIVQAVCRNTATPIEVLTYLTGNSHESVAAKATTALAQHLTISEADLETKIEALRIVTLGPDRTVVPILKEALKSWHGAELDAVVYCAFKRPSPLPRKAWRVLSTRKNWNRFMDTAEGETIQTLAQSPTLTTKMLSTLWERLQHSLLAEYAAPALMERLDPGTELWQDAQARARKVRFALTEVPFTDDMAVDYVTRWLDGTLATCYLPRHLMRHHALGRQLVQRCLERAGNDPDLLSYLAANPALPGASQVELAGTLSAVTALASNSALTPEGALNVLHHCQDEMKQGKLHRAWREAIVALMSNPALPVDLRLNLPAAALLDPWAETHRSLAGVVQLVDEALDGNANNWRAFHTLIREWEGNLGDLIRVVTKL